jgi:hypothetical protein
MQEMEAGFIRLVESVHPLIEDVVGAKELIRVAHERDYE